jgi:hypothetical protein
VMLKLNLVSSQAAATTKLTVARTRGSHAARRWPAVTLRRSC